MKLFSEFLEEFNGNMNLKTGGDFDGDELISHEELMKKFEEKFKQANGNDCIENCCTEKAKPVEETGVKEEIFTMCLNYLRNHTQDELYETVSLAFLAASTFGYIKEEDNSNAV